MGSQPTRCLCNACSSEQQLPAVVVAALPALIAALVAATAAADPVLKGDQKVAAL